MVVEERSVCCRVQLASIFVHDPGAREPAPRISLYLYVPIVFADIIFRLCGGRIRRRSHITLGDEQRRVCSSEGSWHTSSAGLTFAAKGRADATLSSSLLPDKMAMRGDARMQGCKDARMQGCKDARM